MTCKELPPDFVNQSETRGFIFASMCGAIDDTSFNGEFSDLRALILKRAIDDFRVITRGIPNLMFSSRTHVDMCIHVILCRRFVSNGSWDLL